jgi:hypothetical protein
MMTDEQRRRVERRLHLAREADAAAARSNKEGATGGDGDRALALELATRFGASEAELAELGLA